MSVIDDYLKTVEPNQKIELERIRKIVMEVVPDATDTIGYGMPVFRYKDKYMIGMCNFKNHLSIFPGSEVGVVFKDEIKDFAKSKGTLQFTTEKQIPETLLRKIVSHCKTRIDNSK